MPSPIERELRQRQLAPLEWSPSPIANAMRMPTQIQTMKRRKQTEFERVRMHDGEYEQACL
jgi:hypothetical protein